MAMRDDIRQLHNRRTNELTNSVSKVGKSPTAKLGAQFIEGRAPFHNEGREEGNLHLVLVLIAVTN